MITCRLPPEAFTVLAGAMLDEKYGPAFVDNQSMSGWTSEQLLNQLNRGDYNAALAGADIVSVTIGSNDLLGRFMDIIGEAVAAAFQAVKQESGLTDQQLELLMSDKPLTESEEALRQKLPGIIPKIVNNINEAVVEDEKLLAACEKFKTTIQPALLNKLHVLAPDATIYWTTLYNPFFGAKIDVKELFPSIGKLYPDDELIVPLSDPGERYINQMNKAFAVNTEGYYAVDLFTHFNNKGLTNVDIGSDPVTGELHFDIDPHPNAKGHALISVILNERISSTYRLEPEPEPPVDPGNPDTPDNPDSPDNPVTPDNPDSPDTPDTPGDPVRPDSPTDPANPADSTKPASSDKPSKSTLAATGDNLALLPFMVAVLFAAAGCLVVARRHGEK